MAAVADTNRMSSLSPGRVISRVFRLLRARGLVFAAGGVPAVALARASSNWLGPWANKTLAPHVGAAAPMGRFLIAESTPVFGAIVAAFLTAWMTLTLVRSDRAEGAAGAHSIVGALITAAPVLTVVAVVYYASLVFGMLLLIVPGMWVFLSWMLAAPVAAAERVSIGKALARSQKLMKGQRGQIFGLTLLSSVIIFTINAVAAELASGGAPFVEALATANARFLLLPLLGGVEQLFLSAGIAVIYTELVVIKDGGSKHAIAAVFD